MRITTQMLNETARKAGIPIHQSGLLECLNKGEASSDSLLEALQSASTDTVGKTKYEKQEKAADALYTQLRKFTEPGSPSIFEKLEAGDTGELCQETEKLVNDYNRLLSALSKNPDQFDIFYKQSLKGLADDNENALSAIGISIKSDGSLALDKNKLSAASVDSVKSVLGGTQSFATRLAFVSAKIADHAASNLDSISSSYLANGTVAGNYTSRYDFRG